MKVHQRKLTGMFLSLRKGTAKSLDDTPVLSQPGPRKLYDPLKCVFDCQFDLQSKYVISTVHEKQICVRHILTKLEHT